MDEHFIYANCVALFLGSNHFFGKVKMKIFSGDSIFPSNDLK